MTRKTKEKKRMPESRRKRKKKDNNTQVTVLKDKRKNQPPQTKNLDAINTGSAGKLSPIRSPPNSFTQTPTRKSQGGVEEDLEGFQNREADPQTALLDNINNLLREYWRQNPLDPESATRLRLPEQSILRFECSLDAETTTLQFTIGQSPEQKQAQQQKERLKKIVSVHTQVMLKPTRSIVIPLRLGDSLREIQSYMCETYGYTENDPMYVKVGKKKLSWDKKLHTILDNNEMEEDALQIKLWVPKAKGRQKVFIRLDLNNQRVLHKGTFFKACKEIGIKLSKKEFERVWKILDCRGQNLISYKQFQNIVSPEANITEFAAMVPLLASIPNDEFRKVMRAEPETRRAYVLACSQIVSDKAKFCRMQRAKDVYSLFGAFDAYMEGQITLNLMRRELEICGVELTSVHLQLLLSKFSESGHSQFFTLNDFVRIMSGKEECTLDQFTDAIIDILSNIGEDEYRAKWRQVFTSKASEQKSEKVYRLAKRTPREVLGLPEKTKMTSSPI